MGGEGGGRGQPHERSHNRQLWYAATLVARRTRSRSWHVVPLTSDVPVLCQARRSRWGETYGNVHSQAAVACSAAVFPSLLSLYFTFRILTWRARSRCQIGPSAAAALPTRMRVLSIICGTNGPAAGHHTARKRAPLLLLSPSLRMKI